MALPAIFYPHDPTQVRFLPTDGVRETFGRFREPGDWYDGSRREHVRLLFPSVTQVTDLELTGDDPSTGDWVLTITPTKTAHGAASADAMAPASITFTAAATLLADVVLGLIAAASDSASLASTSDLATWVRFNSYVTLSVSPSGAEVLRITSKQVGAEFSVTLTTPAANGYTPTMISAPSTSTIKVGFYVAIDRDAGVNGYGETNEVLVKEIESTTPAADIVGPVYRGTDTLPVEPGFAYREYGEGSDMSGVAYGHIHAYGERVIPKTSIDSPVYVRRVASGDLLPGMIIDQAGAEALATAAVNTLTPVAADDTLYSVSVTVDGELIGTLSYTSGAGATADDIADGYRDDLALKPAISALITADAGPGSPLVLTGPADGRSVVIADVGVGDSGIVATTAGASHHILLPRGDKFISDTDRIGSAPVSVPHPHA